MRFWVTEHCRSVLCQRGDQVGWSGTLVGEYWSYVVQLPASVLAWLSLYCVTTLPCSLSNSIAPTTLHATYHLHARHRPSTPRLASCTSQNVDTKTTRKCISVFGQTNLLRLWLFWTATQSHTPQRQLCIFRVLSASLSKMPWRLFSLCTIIHLSSSDGH